MAKTRVEKLAAQVAEQESKNEKMQALREEMKALEGEYKTHAEARAAAEREARRVRKEMDRINREIAVVALS